LIRDCRLFPDVPFLLNLIIVTLLRPVLHGDFENKERKGVLIFDEKLHEYL
jgi:hypothetical protein